MDCPLRRAGREALADCGCPWHVVPRAWPPILIVGVPTSLCRGRATSSRLGMLCRGQGQAVHRAHHEPRQTVQRSARTYRARRTFQSLLRVVNSGSNPHNLQGELLLPSPLPCPPAEIMGCVSCLGSEDVVLHGEWERVRVLHPHPASKEVRGLSRKSATVQFVEDADIS